MEMGIVENVFGSEVDHIACGARHAVSVRSAKAEKSFQAQWTPSAHYQGPPRLSMR